MDLWRRRKFASADLPVERVRATGWSAGGDPAIL